MVDPKALYESDDVEWLRKPDREVEGPWIERKETFDANEIARQISGFANGQPPGGLIVVGSDQEGRRIGLGAGRDKAYSDLGRIQSVVDGATWHHRFVRPGTDEEMLYFWVPFSTNRVVSRSDGRAFVREGSSTRELRPEEIQELRYARGEQRFEEEPIVPYESTQVDQTAAAELLTGIIEKNSLTLPLTLEDALANKKLTVRRGQETHLTVAGLLAVGSAPTERLPGAKVHFQRFDGIQERFGSDRNVTKERWFEGPTTRMLREVEEFVATLVSEFDYLGPEGRFVTEPEYPRTAWEEAIVNAVAHRSYSIRNAPIVIRMFDDRLEVESPGGYPGAQRPSADGVFPFSYPSNPNWGQALRYLGLVKLAKEGTRRMSEEMKKLGLPPPTYEEIGGMAVRVTLRNDLVRRRSNRTDPSDQWSEVARLIGHSLAIYRQKGVQQWFQLRGVGRGARGAGSAPKKVLEATVRRLDDPSVPIPEKSTLFRLLNEEPESSTESFVQELARRLQLPTKTWFFDPTIRDEVATFLARSDVASKAVLESLEYQNVPDVDAQKFAFLVLICRLRRDPLPADEWTYRALAASRKFPPEVTQGLELQITGGDTV